MKPKTMTLADVTKVIECAIVSTTMALRPSGDRVAVPCPNCDFESWLPKEMVEKRRKDGKYFYCPYGHSMGYGKGGHDTNP